MPFKDSITAEEHGALQESDRVLYIKKAGENGAADSYTLHPSFVAERTALSTTNKTILAEKKAAADKLKAYEELGLDAAAIAELKQKHEEAEAAKLTDAEKKTKAEQALKESHTKELERIKTEAKAREDFLTRELRRTNIEASAVAAITEAGGQVKPLLPHVIAAMELVEDGEGDDRKFVTRVMGPDKTPRYVGSEFMTVSQLVEEIKRDEAFGGLFKATGAGGGGATNTTKAAGAAGGVTIKRSQWDQLDAQGRADHMKAGGRVVD